jgi:DegV family protein with EDD domain
MPSTSQATVATFMQIFQNLLDQDYQILAILVSAKLSGTINSAMQAKEHLPTGAPIEVVDSQSVSMGMGFNTLRVARAVAQGASLPEAVALAHQTIGHTGVVLTVETLDFLHRGGRIGSASRFMGTALNIKPILEVREGRVEAVERVRTRGKSLSRVVELVEEQIGGQTPVHIAALHANAEADARILLDEVSRRLKVDEQIFSIVGPVVGTHAGPGTLGLAYLAGL